ncbi:hypothetical protein LNP04_18025 [Chryseobacterium sp. C-71]|uniref:hypothetical protein n=1 Tax=Chryseobacterium sp. C-71 TaxID=2893882 RepID=UPI001E61E185|nr:hypothetical protein [Chryseobacterium sp. C-71]UFH31841.1 hypothetical protein LNP04_18025 [Chryseobacterium sp. C-71]
MKTKFYYFAIILMANFSICFGQTYTLKVEDKEKATENFPRYNLFYLSKLIADNSMSVEERDKTYYALKSTINDESLITNSQLKFSELSEFIQKLKNDKAVQVKIWISSNPNFKVDHKDIILETSKKTKLTLEVMYNLIKEKNTNLDSLDKEIKDFEKSTNELQATHSYQDLENYKSTHKFDEQKLKQIISDYYTNVDKVDKAYNIYIIKSLEDLKNTLLQNEQDEERKQIVKNLKYLFSSIEFNQLPDDIKKKILSSYYMDKNGSFYFKNLETLKKEIRETIISKLISTYSNDFDLLTNDLEIFANEFVQISLDKNSSTLSTKLKEDIKKVSSVSNFSVSKEQQIIINSQIQTAQAQTGSSGIKIPSQSQMIEAMAIFLAKRAKQEAAIWFMDQIRLKMNNPMILDVFPETIKVMEGAENYKVPTFNATWKYAIAKDFVEMPRNLVQSPWVEKVIIKDSINHARLRQSVEFGYDLNRLMTEQYNYRDIIKYFYINPRLEVEKNGKDKVNQEINRLIDNSSTLLYIVTNEFFSIDNIDGKDVYRLLSYEEIAGLNEQEYQTLLELIDLKYGERLNQFKIMEAFKSKKQELNKWMGNILISLSQFDKIRNDYQTKKEEIKDDLASKNFYNVWSVLNQLTTNLYSDELFKSPKIDNIKIKLDWIKTGMSVYEHFQNNDYVGAANQTFGLINLLNNETNINSNYKNFYYNFGKNKQISVVFDKNSYTLKRIHHITKDNIPIYNKNFISFSFLDKDNLCIKINNSPQFPIPTKDLNEFLIISNYTTKDKNVRMKLLDELLEKNENGNIKTLSDSLGIDQSEMIRLINYIYIANNSLMIDKKNLSDIFTELNFDFVRDESLNILNNYDHKYTKQLTNLLSFFGDVLTVKDEHQLAGIIDSYALPPTSYKLKRKKPSSIDLNAYVGAFGGGLMSLKSTTIGSQPVYGITAPIGIAFTWSRNGWYDNYSFTVDVVDLGNVVNHYLVKPGEDYARDVHFSEVFSLGTTFLMGIKNSPFVISGGFRFQPYNTGKDANNKVFDAGIYHLGVKIDIPLIHLSGKDF